GPISLSAGSTLPKAWQRSSGFRAFSLVRSHKQTRDPRRLNPAPGFPDRKVRIALSNINRMSSSSVAVTIVPCSLKNKRRCGLVLLWVWAVCGTSLETVSQERQTLIPGAPKKSDVALTKQITALEAELKTRPTDVEVLFRLGKLFHQQGTFQKSISLFERIIVLRPRHLDAHILLGMDRFHAGRAREAIEPLRRAVELDFLNEEANFYLGLCFLSLDREDEATKAFNRLASQAPATVDELYLLTRAYSRLSSAMLSQLATLGENSY